MPPPSWSYGDDAEADELLARVLDGRKTATALAVAELEQVGLEVPRVGDLSIVVDEAGTRGRCCAPSRSRWCPSTR